MVTDSIRLHITPLSPDLLKAVVGPHLLNSVTNISYHTIQTFPENDYGYIDLSRMEGEKLKKKLNGAILKGRKIKVEEARPKKRRRTEEPEEDVVKEESKATTAEKPKKERSVITGYELSPDRKIKRGWTEAKSTKSSKKDKGKVSSSGSKYMDKDELLFRTTVPPHKLDRTDKAKKEKGKSRKKNNGELMVHEFEKSTKQPSFLKQDVGLGIKGNLQYVEGQGWVDEAGQVIEKESEGIARRREVTGSRAQSKRKLAKPTDRYSETSTFSSEDEDSDGIEAQPNPSDVEQGDETSSSGSSLASESEEEGDESASPRLRSNEPEPNGQSQVHPLEALFKKPKNPASQDIAKPSLELATTFSFFDSDNVDDLDEAPGIPLTPFSSQDNRARGLRSAAPTPDTAHPSRFNSYGSSGLPGDEEMSEDGARLVDKVSSKKQHGETPLHPQSDFEKKFWENRAENNRAWKLRRRTVLKEKGSAITKHEDPRTGECWFVLRRRN